MPTQPSTAARTPTGTPVRRSARFNQMSILREGLRRLGRPTEVASAIYFLCCDAASYVNGAELHVNGGQHV